MKTKRTLTFLMALAMLCILSPAQAGYNPLDISTSGSGAPVYSDSRGSRQTGLLYNGFSGSLSLSATNGLYSLNLSPDYTVWIDQKSAEKNAPQQPCNAWLAEVITQNAPLSTAPGGGRITARHAAGTLVTVWGEFGDYYYVQDYSWTLTGFFSRSSLRKIKELTYDDAASMLSGVSGACSAVVHTGGLPLDRCCSATGWCDTASYAPLEDGQTVTVLARLGDWVQLADGGFIESRFLEPQGEHGRRYAYVTSDHPLNRLNLRADARRDAYSRAKLCAGTRVELISRTDEWACVRLDGGQGGLSLVGCVQLQYLSLTESPSESGAVPVRLTETLYAGNSGNEYRIGWSGAALPAGTLLTVIGVESNADAYMEYPDQLLARTEDGRLIKIWNDNGVLEPLQDTGFSARTDSSLKMRAAPRKDAAVMKTLSRGTKVEVLLRGEGWTMIRCKEQTGYVMSRYLVFP